MKKQRIIHYSALLAIIFLATIFIMPVVTAIIKSFCGGDDRITLRGYSEFFIWQPEFIEALIRSLTVSGTVTFFSLLVAIPAAYVFAKVPFRGREIIFFVYIIVMIMPFQVTLLPHYLVSREIGTYDTPLALILPGIFAPFSAFLLTQMTRSISDEIIEAARLETSSIFVILTKIIVPSVKPGIACAAVLSFCEEWNKISEPMTLLQSPEQFPLSILLTGGFENDIVYMAGVIIFMLFPLLLFGFFEEKIVEGLKDYRLK